jgi:hypothetical protein
LLRQGRSPEFDEEPDDGWRDQSLDSAWLGLVFLRILLLSALYCERQKNKQGTNKFALRIQEFYGLQDFTAPLLPEATLIMWLRESEQVRHYQSN